MILEYERLVHFAAACKRCDWFHAQSAAFGIARYI